MTDLLGNTDLKTSANAQTDHGSVAYDGSASGAASAGEGGADLGAVTDHALAYDTEHASGAVDVGGALDGAASVDGVHGDVSATGGFDAMLDAMEDLWASVSGSLSAMLGF